MRLPVPGVGPEASTSTLIHASSVAAFGGSSARRLVTARSPLELGRYCRHTFRGAAVAHPAAGTKDTTTRGIAMTQQLDAAPGESRLDTAEKQAMAGILESAQRLGVELDEGEALRWVAAIEAEATGGDVVVDVDSGVYGHRVTMLDFSTADLARFRAIGKIVGFGDRRGV